MKVWPPSYYIICLWLGLVPVGVWVCGAGFHGKVEQEAYMLVDFRHISEATETLALTTILAHSPFLMIAVGRH